MQDGDDSVVRDTEVTHVTARRLTSASHSYSDCRFRGRSNHSARNCEAYRRDRREGDCGATNPGYFRCHRPKRADAVPESLRQSRSREQRLSYYACFYYFINTLLSVVYS